MYTQAIGDFIKVANKKNTTVFDTIFIANRKLNQPDDFPDIELPSQIENTRLSLSLLTLPKYHKMSENQEYIST